jgi:periplasmic protein TonB
MSSVRFIAVSAALLLALSGAHDSTKAEDNASGTGGACPVRPAHAVSLAMSSDDYPILSVAQNEQGQVTLDFLIRPDGSVTDVRVAKSSGFARLDGAAVDIAGQRWHFDPVTVNGKPISCRYEVAVAWTLNWTPEQLDRSGLAVVRLGASDYPADGLARHEAGQTLVMAVVNPDGKIVQATIGQSSGFSDLDVQALAFVKSGKWPVGPARVYGKAVTAMIGFLIIWSP